MKAVRMKDRSLYNISIYWAGTGTLRSSGRPDSQRRKPRPARLSSPNRTVAVKALSPRA